MKNVTFNDVNELEQEHNAMRSDLPPSVNDELDANRASTKRLIQLRYAALAIFIGLVGFILIAS